MATGIHLTTPPVVCRLLSDPTLLTYFLNWSIPGGPVTPCSDLWSSFLPFPGPLVVLGFVSLAVEGPALHMGGVWACRMTRWQPSNTPGPQPTQFGTTNEEKPLETAGEREQYNSYDNCGCRSIYSHCKDLNLSWARAWIFTNNITKHLLKLGEQNQTYSKVSSTHR